MTEEKRWAEINKISSKEISAEEIKEAKELEREACKKWLDHIDEPKEVRDKYWYKYTAMHDILVALGLA